MSFDLGKLFIEWRRIVPNGVPNPGNAYHLVLLKEICMAKGIDRNSSLYKAGFFTSNFGAVQNEDFEFVSVS